MRTKKDYELKGVSYDACGRERCEQARVRTAAEWAMLANECWKKQTGKGAQKRTLTSTDISPLTKTSKYAAAVPQPTYQEYANRQ